MLTVYIVQECDRVAGVTFLFIFRICSIFLPNGLHSVVKSFPELIASTVASCLQYIVIREIVIMPEVYIVGGWSN